MMNKMIPVLAVAWIAGLVAFFAAQHLFLGSALVLDWSLPQTAVDMSPLAAPAFVLSIPVVLWLKRPSGPSAKTVVLAISGVIAAVLPLPAVLFVISGSWVALRLGEHRWLLLLTEAVRSGEALLLLTQYAVTGGVLGAGYGWISNRRPVEAPRT